MGVADEGASQMDLHSLGGGQALLPRVVLLLSSQPLHPIPTLYLGYDVDPLPKKGSVFTLKNRSVFQKCQLKNGRVFGGYGGTRTNYPTCKCHKSNTSTPEIREGPSARFCPWLWKLKGDPVVAEPRISNCVAGRAMDDRDRPCNHSAPLLTIQNDPAQFAWGRSSDASYKFGPFEVARGYHSKGGPGVVGLARLSEAEGR